MVNSMETSTPSTALGSFQTAALLSEHWPPPARIEIAGLHKTKASFKSSSASSGCFFYLPIHHGSTEEDCVPNE
eukprot:6213169-Pleurochrysis_carterae.AAC.2